MPVRLLLAALLMCASALPAHAQWREVPYAEAVKMALGLKRADPEGVFTSYFVLRPNKGAKALPADLQFRIRTDGETVDVPVSAAGRVAFPIRQDWADQGAAVLVNKPKGSFAMSFGMDARTPTGTRMTYARLGESAIVLERGIRDMAGLMSFMAPKVRALLLDFAPGTPQTAELQLADGTRKVFRTDAKGRIRLPWRREWATANVALSAPLAKIDPELK